MPTKIDSCDAQFFKLTTAPTYASINHVVCVISTYFNFPGPCPYPFVSNFL